MELIIVVLICVGALVLGLVVGANNHRRVDAARKAAEERARTLKEQAEEWKNRQG